MRKEYILPKRPGRFGKGTELQEMKSVTETQTKSPLSTWAKYQINQTQLRRESDLVDTPE